MKKISALIFVIGLGLSFNANAWFFFFIPPFWNSGSSTSSNDAGKICMKNDVKVGDIQTSLNGNTLTIIDVEGSSSRCKDPTPIVASVKFNQKFNSKAGINLSDDWEPIPIVDLDRYNGWVVKAKSKTAKKALFILTSSKKNDTNLKDMGNAFMVSSSNTFNEISVLSTEESKLDNLNAVQITFSGKTKATFPISVTSLVTIIEGKNEYLTVETRSQSDEFSKFKDEFKQIPMGIKGLDGQVTLDVSNDINSQTTIIDSFEESKKKCSEIGFKAGTEAFGNCVLKLTK